MITLVQRVQWARVMVEHACVGAIEHGVLLFVGVEQGDTQADADATARKIANMRLFAGRTPMDLCLQDVGGACLVVSQFTLAAELRHGNRPDFGAAAGPALAEPLYERVASELAATGLTVATGRFGASMQVELCNDGPVSLVLNVRGGKVVPRGEPTKPTS
ncbi:MAG TPA: D-aminoacyl-tRNA deacylase [Planctomycetota bacterium]|nr:D-aminoacyl-tRNA deacylase [Planctomycetota bacterium]